MLETVSHPYLVGIKGVAQTALAQCLQDQGKQVAGCDVAEDFVTQSLLQAGNFTIQTGFADPIPPETDLVIYTSAHLANKNPSVVQAQQAGIPTLSHAQALAELFNQKSGIAVCGVGGKSTTSALLSWIMAESDLASYAVGVGNIIGLNKTGHWSATSQYFIAEADEYVTDPSAPSRGEKITPRFSYLKPAIIICTNLQFDHPDVYKDFDHTKQIFADFFRQLKPNGILIYNADDTELSQLVATIMQERPDLTSMSYGFSPAAELVLSKPTYHSRKSSAPVTFKDQTYTLQSQLPGAYNLANAAAAFLCCLQLKLDTQKVLLRIADFQSTLRRSEYKGSLAGADFFDDYAHHPTEVESVITAFKQWYPHKKLVVAFQPHTYSRTKALLPDFAQALSQADEIILLKIFASAREQDLHDISNQDLQNAILTHSANNPVQLAETLPDLAKTIKNLASPDTVILTLGAGDIYEVYKFLEVNHD